MAENTWLSLGLVTCNTPLVGAPCPSIFFCDCKGPPPPYKIYPTLGISWDSDQWVKVQFEPGQQWYLEVLQNSERLLRGFRMLRVLQLKGIRLLTNVLFGSQCHIMTMYRSYKIQLMPSHRTSIFPQTGLPVGFSLRKK